MIGIKDFLKKYKEVSRKEKKISTLNLRLNKLSKDIIEAEEERNYLRESLYESYLKSKYVSYTEIVSIIDKISGESGYAEDIKKDLFDYIKAQEKEGNLVDYAFFDREGNNYHMMYAKLTPDNNLELGLEEKEDSKKVLVKFLQD